MPLFRVKFVNCFLVCFVLFFIEDYEMGDKRKKVVMTMEEKLHAIKRLDSGVTAKTIASERCV